MVLSLVLIGPSVGANAVLFSLADGFLFRSLPYSNSERLIVVQQRSRIHGREFATISIAERDALRKQPEIERVTGYSASQEVFDVPLAGVQVARVRVAAVDDAFFETLGVPARGSGEPIALERHNPAATVLSHRIATVLAGTPASAIGRTFLTKEGRTFIVQGVLPETFVYPLFGLGPQPDALVASAERAEMADRDRVFAIALVRKNVDLRHLGGVFERASTTVSAEFPSLQSSALQQKPMLKGLLANYRPVVWSMMGVSVVILLASSATFGVMLVDWTLRRKRELGCRLAMGASHLGVATQLVMEAMMLVALATLPALIAGAFVLDYLRPRLPEVVFRTLSHELNQRTVFVSLCVTIVIGILGSIWPILRLTKGREFRLQFASSDQTTRWGGRIAFGLLLALQVAATVTVVGGVVRVGSTVANFAQTRLGLNPEGSFALNFAVGHDRTPSTKYQRLTETIHRLRNVPGVIGVGASQALPLAGIEPEEILQPPNVAGAQLWRATSGYFMAAGIPVLEGREFVDLDRPNASAIVSSLYASLAWPGKSAIGRVVHIGAPPVPAVVIGVAGDTRQRFEQSIAPAVYLAFDPAQFRPLPLLVRTTLPTAEARPALLSQIDYGGMPRRPEITSMRDYIDRALMTQRFQLLVMQLWTIVAISLSCAGTLVVSTRIVFRRWREFAIRSALGETAVQLVTRVALEIALACLPGIALGLTALLLADRVLGALVVGMLPTSYKVYTVAALTTAVLTAISLGPAVLRLRQMNVSAVLRRLD